MADGASSETLTPATFAAYLKWLSGMAVRSAVSGVLGLYHLDDQEGEELVGREGKRSEVVLSNFPIIFCCHFQTN